MNSKCIQISLWILVVQIQQCIGEHDSYYYSLISNQRRPHQIPSARHVQRSTSIRNSFNGRLHAWVGGGGGGGDYSIHPYDYYSPSNSNRISSSLIQSASVTNSNTSTASTKSIFRPSYNKPIQSSISALNLEEDELTMSLGGGNNNDHATDDTQITDKQQQIFDLFGSNSSDKTGGSPKSVVYRYFGRSRVRDPASTVHFIFLGPVVDHWANAAHILSSMGFNVMACEVITNDSRRDLRGGGASSSAVGSFFEDEEEEEEDGADLVEEVLDALQWKKAVIVGCDDSAIDAIEAALSLAPEHKVAGLILCGDLTKAVKFVKEEIEEMGQEPQKIDSPRYNSEDVDMFLSKYITCPTAIVYDGDASLELKRKAWDHAASLSDHDISHDAVRRIRVLGGGEAPHRRLPDQFAWVLTNFVDNEVSVKPLSGSKALNRHQQYELEESDENPNLLMTIARDLREHGFSAESLVVTGRVVAYGLLYVACARSVVTTYHAMKQVSTVLMNVATLEWVGKLCAKLFNVATLGFSRKYSTFGGHDGSMRLRRRRFNKGEESLDGSDESNHKPSVTGGDESEKREIGRLDGEEGNDVIIEEPEEIPLDEDECDILPVPEGRFRGPSDFDGFSPWDQKKMREDEREFRINFPYFSNSMST